MSRPVSNPQQLLASHPEKHIWVAASAGSGKTKVLTDRVLRLLLQRTPPSQILCITYTKAAASEMQTRIHDTLGRWVMQDDATLREELYAVSGETPTPAILVYARSLFARLLEHVPGLRIQTIHAFCQSILARFPLEAGVPAHFQILDERSQQELLQEAQIWLLQHGLDSHAASPDTATDTTDTTTALTQALHVLSLELGESKFKDVIHSIIHNRTKIEQTLIQLNNKIYTNNNVLDVDFSPTASPLCAELYRRLELDISFTSRDDILRHYFPHDTHARRILQDVAESFTAFGTDTEKKNTAFFYEIAQAAALTDTLREKYVQFFFTDKGEPRSTKGFPTGKVKDNAPWIADWIARETDKMLAFRKDCGAFQTAYQSYYMVVLAQALFARYRRLKDVRGWLDYEDIIIHTRNLLCGERMMPWVLFKLDEGISHILVDEAQDTSPLQWELIGAIASEFFSGEGAREQQRTLFVVGDEKQSIYRFQGADVASFMRMREQLRQQVKASGDTLHIVRLAMSFVMRMHAKGSQICMMTPPSSTKHFVHLRKGWWKYGHSFR
jgi:ATP-dependent helicase/nuclease subunit A